MAKKLLVFHFLNSRSFQLCLLAHQLIQDIAILLCPMSARRWTCFIIGGAIAILFGTRFAASFSILSLQDPQTKILRESLLSTFLSNHLCSVEWTYHFYILSLILLIHVVHDYILGFPSLEISLQIVVRSFQLG